MIENKASLAGVFFSGINYEHFLIKKFGIEILKRKAKEVEQLALIEDIHQIYENWLAEKQQRERK